MYADRLNIQWRGVLPIVVALLAAQACVSAELPPGVEEAPIRDDSERPPDPSTDPDASRPDQGQPDMSTTPDMPDMDGPPDMPTDPPDMPVDPPDMPAGCPAVPECAFGAQECVGDRVRTCTRDAQQCPVWGAIVACSNGFSCQGSSCQPIPQQCVDNDGDGRGPGCAAGPDCDDNDRTRYPGAPELCDNRDNDCNNLVDDGVPGVGQACSAGQGACLSTGSQVCDSQGNLACDATPRAGSAEICDGVDNDCDGATDEDNVCNSGTTGVCAGDTYQEPNDSLAAARPIPMNTPFFGATCSADKDFFTLAGLTAGQSTRINLAFDHAVSDLDLFLYRDGTRQTSATSSSDHETLTFTPQAGSTYAIEIRPISGNNNFYRLEVLPASQLACSSDDAFEQNDSRARAAFLVRSSASSSSDGLELNAYSCSYNDDWYDLGNITAGQTVWGEIWNPSCVFSCPDFDLELHWYDPATGSTVVKNLSNGLYDTERVEHAVTAADAGRYYLRVFNFGDQDSYRVMFNKY